MNAKNKNNTHSSQAIDKPDIELIRACRNGDKETFARIIQRYQDNIYTYVSQNISPEQQADDITRDIFVSAYKLFPQFSGDSSVKAWLLSLAEKHLVRASRKQQKWYRRLLPFFLRRQPLETETSQPPQSAADTSDCQSMTQLFSEYLDGELNELDAKRVEKHLQHCASCSQEFDELLDTVNLLQTFGPIKAPGNLRAQINAEIEQIQPAEKIFSQMFHSPGFALAASLVCFVLGFFLSREYYRSLLAPSQGTHLVRGENTPIPSVAKQSKFVLLTGTLVSGDLFENIEPVMKFVEELKQGNSSEQIVPQPIPGNAKELHAQLTEKIATLPAKIIEEHTIHKNNLIIRKMVVELPENSSLIFSAFFQQRHPQKNQDTQNISTIRLEFYIIDSQ